MTHVIRVSNQGFDVTNIDGKRVRKPSGATLLPHLLYALALPYLFGAKKQIERYQQAASTLKERPVRGVYECLHEASTLFEDLSTVAKYAEMCGHKNKLHQLWFDVRNHIRHDVREEFDRESSLRKNKRTERLKLNPSLQTNLEFTDDSIKVGGVLIETEEINNYLEWAKVIIENTLNEARRKGHIK